MPTRPPSLGPATLSALFITAAGLVLPTACTDAELTEDDGFEEHVEDEDDATAALTTRAEFEAYEAAVRKHDPPQVDNGDGTWSYALDDDFDPDAEIQGDVLTWYYAGQAQFSHRPTHGEPRTWIATEQRPVDPRDQLFAMKRVDRRGRIWKVAAVDQEAWMASRASSASTIENEDDPPGVGPTLRAPDADYAPGTPVTWHPSSWSHQSCQVGGGVFGANEGHFWDGDSRNQVFNPTARQQTAVEIRVDTVTKCSGVILREDQVLTAAHCLSDDNNNPLAVGTVSVARDDIYEVRNVSNIDFPGTYGGGSGQGGGTDFADDWAIVELSAPWSAGFEDMALSEASDNTLSNLTQIHNLAFPGFFPDCTEIIPGAVLIHNVEQEPIAAILNKKLRFKIDGVPAQSGSPLYYCPEGDDNVCGAGEQGYVFAVFAGYNPATKRFVGPKSTSFRDAAMAFLDD